MANRRPIPNMFRKAKRRELVARIRELKEANRQAFPILSTFPIPVERHKIETMTVERLFQRDHPMYHHDKDRLLAMAERSAGEAIAHEILDRRYMQVVPVDGPSGIGFRYILRIVDWKSL